MITPFVNPLFINLYNVGLTIHLHCKIHNSQFTIHFVPLMVNPLRLSIFQKLKFTIDLRKQNSSATEPYLSFTGYFSGAVSGYPLLLLTPLPACAKAIALLLLLRGIRYYPG